VLFYQQHICSILFKRNLNVNKINGLLKEEDVANQIISGSTRGIKMPSFNLDRQRRLFIGLILLMALLAFEIFNFDTTQFALQSLLGDVRFLGIMWATILAIAFCSIDFAGLIRLFTPENGSGVNKEGWYLMGAWLLGATMNAIMTWWAVSVTLINHNFGNEVLSHEQLLRYVPIFVAILVWLTRILFIGAFSIAGAQLFETAVSSTPTSPNKVPKTSQSGSQRRKTPGPNRFDTTPNTTSKVMQTESYTPIENEVHDQQPVSTPPSPPPSQTSVKRTSSMQRSSRVRNRPPTPNGGLRKPGSRIQARHRN
jgi:hypothetical protein